MSTAASAQLDIVVDDEQYLMRVAEFQQCFGFCQAAKGIPGLVAILQDTGTTGQGGLHLAVQRISPRTVHGDGIQARQRRHGRILSGINCPLPGRKPCCRDSQVYACALAMASVSGSPSAS